MYKFKCIQEQSFGPHLNGHSPHVGKGAANWLDNTDLIYHQENYVSVSIFYVLKTI
jgi:hypothetical protein